MKTSKIIWEVFVPLAVLRVEVTRLPDLKQVFSFLRETENPADLITSERRDASDWFAQDFQSAMSMPGSKPL